MAEKSTIEECFNNMLKILAEMQENVNNTYAEILACLNDSHANITEDKNI